MYGKQKEIKNNVNTSSHWQVSLDLVIQYFVSPVPSRAENQDVKEEARSHYTSMVVMKGFLRISSVSTEQ